MKIAEIRSKKLLYEIAAKNFLNEQRSLMDTIQIRIRELSLPGAGYNKKGEEISLLHLFTQEISPVFPSSLSCILRTL